MNRREWLQRALALGAAGGGLGGAGFVYADAPAQRGSVSKPRVVVVGGGFSGATAARYLRQWSEGRVEVVLVEAGAKLISCPTSNEVIAGFRPYSSLAQEYTPLEQNWGVLRVRATALDVDPVNRFVVTDTAGKIPYDRLILAPGVEFVPDSIAGFDPQVQPGAARALGVPLHAWKAGEQTLALRQQLEAMPNGGIFVLSIPLSPYRCPPGPYERACLVADYFRRYKPNSKVVVLDANERIQSKEALFRQVWETRYAGLIEYHPRWKVAAFDARNRSVLSDFGEIQRGDVFNLIPPQRAGGVARRAGVVNVNDLWVGINWLNFESQAVPHVHVLGDAVQAAPLMPKSGHMANQHGKAVAAALLAEFAGETPAPFLLTNTCYSRVDAERAIHVSSVHRYDSIQKTPLVVPGSGGLSREPSEIEGGYAESWARSIWRDILG